MNGKKQKFLDWLEQEKTFAAETAQQQETRNQRTQELSQRAVARYQAEVASLRPQAQASLLNTIIPWWEEAAPLLAKLPSMSKFQLHHPFRVSSSFPFFYPRRALAWQNSLDRQSESLLDLNERLKPEQLVNSNEHWVGFFGIRLRQELILVAGIWPNNRGSMAFSYAAPQYEVWLNQEVDRFLDRAHPNIILGFAGEIESGKVWEKLRGE